MTAYVQYNAITIINLFLVGKQIMDTLSLSLSHTHCSTQHWSTNNWWESWISLLSITSLRTAIPSCLICSASIPPVEMWHAQTHTETHTGRLLRNINTIRVNRGEENWADLIGVVYIPPRRAEQLKLALLSADDPTDVNNSNTTSRTASVYFWGFHKLKH